MSGRLLWRFATESSSQPISDTGQIKPVPFQVGFGLIVDLKHFVWINEFVFNGVQPVANLQRHNAN